MLVLLGQGDGTFHQPVSHATDACPTSPVVADMNNDRVPDVAVVASGLIQVFLGSGDGTLLGPCTSAVNQGTVYSIVFVEPTNPRGFGALVAALPGENAIALLQWVASPQT